MNVGWRWGIWWSFGDLGENVENDGVWQKKLREGFDMVNVASHTD